MEKVDTKKIYFRAVKKRYRRGPFLEKVKKTGGKPDWDSIRNYTPEELEFLILLGNGKTIQQEQACIKHYNIRIFDLPSDLYKDVMKSCWKDFAMALGDRKILKEGLEKEEELQRIYKIRKND